MPVMLLRLLLALLALCSFASASEAGCSTSSTALAFASSSSYAVLAGSVVQVSGTAGLSCSGSALSVLGGSYARATITSANNFKLSAGASDAIPYQVSADSGGTVVFTQGGTVDYFSSSTLGLGGSNASAFNSSLYAKLTAAPNIAAGSYTDTLTVSWDYSICSGVQVGGVCTTYEKSKVTDTVTVTLIVGRDCRISAPNVSFGTVALVSQFPSISQAALVDCTKGAAYNIAFSSGQNGSARPWRAMTDGAGHKLQYNIYRTDGTTIWDETNPLASATLGTGSTTQFQLQSYLVKVNAAQAAPPAGSYSDTINVVVSF